MKRKIMLVEDWEARLPILLCWIVILYATTALFFLGSCEKIFGFIIVIMQGLIIFEIFFRIEEVSQNE